MASPAPDANGISTPPATASAAHTNSPPASAAPSLPTAPLPSVPTASHPATTPTTSYPPTSLLDAGTSKRPRDARLLHLLLANMGVAAYTERVPLQLLDFAYRYTSGVLTDALAYEPPVPAAAEKKKRDVGADEGVSLNALRTSVAGRASMMGAGGGGGYGGGGGLGKEVLGEVASERNRVALPRVEREFGVRLPPERYCFTGVGWGVKRGWEEEVEDGEESEAEEGKMEGGPVGGGFAAEAGAQAEGDTQMGGMEDEEEEVDEDEFQEVMG